MSGCIICGGELPPKGISSNGRMGVGRKRIMCGSLDCRRVYNRAAARKSYRRLRELNARGVFAKWQHKTKKPRKPRET